MKSAVLTIDNREESYQKALQQAEKIADKCNLQKKDALHLRLLTEETMGLFRALTGEVMAQFWIEAVDQAFLLHLTVRTQMDSEKRSELLSVSTSGKNAAAKGFTGKLRDVLERAMASTYVAEEEDTDGSTVAMLQQKSSNTMMGGYGKGTAYAIWSMDKYREEAESDNDQDASDESDAWDELEKSIVGRLANDISVSIRGREVEMVITMKLTTPAE